jgi:hypothetical protein
MSHKKVNGSNGDFPIGLPEVVFRRIMEDLHDYEEGIALRRIRQYLELSLEQAASYACLSASELDRIECGIRHAPRDTLIRLCLRSYDLSIPQANEILLLAKFAPLTRPTAG